jgi:DNA-binding FadR family transcriptional regulator
MPKNFNRINDAESLSWKVEKAIKEAIISGTYQPREQLPGEIDLSNQFGVSRPVVREAMKSLKSRGFLEIKRGKGGELRQRPGPAIFQRKFYRFNQA